MSGPKKTENRKQKKEKENRKQKKDPGVTGNLPLIAGWLVFIDVYRCT